MPDKNGPVGIFDSGVGGLSIAAAIRSLLPAESLLYYADRCHFPYGSRSEEEVRQFSGEATEFLLERGVKAVVVACNTASSASLSYLRARFQVPFVGVVPGIKPGTLASGSARVGVLATEATFNTRVFADLVAQFAEGVEVHCQVCPDLVALVEAGAAGTPEAAMRVQQYLAPLFERGVDAIVLGCTHYSFLRPAIECAAGKQARVIDTAVPVARQLVRVLEAGGLLRDGDGAGGIEFFTSGGTADEDEFRAVVARLWPAAQELCRDLS